MAQAVYSFGKTELRLIREAVKNGVCEICVDPGGDFGRREMQALAALLNKGVATNIESRESVVHFKNRARKVTYHRFRVTPVKYADKTIFESV